MESLPLTEIFGQILKLGLPGIIILALSWWVVKREKEFKALWEARVAEWKEMATLARASTEALAGWIPANEARTRAVDASIEAHKLQIATIQGLTGQIDRMDADVLRALESNQKMREAVIRMSAITGRPVDL